MAKVPSHIRLVRPLLAALAALSLSAAVHAADVTISLSNNGAAGGVGLAPLWVGFQGNAASSLFAVGAAASAGLEQAAEDGSAAGLTREFADAHPGGVQGTLAGGPAFPGDTRSLSLTGLDLAGANRYLSYMAMVVLSSDYFIGSATPIDLSSIANGGTLTLLIGGDGQVFDAGTEVNDFNTSVANAAFGIGGGQTAPGQGADEHGVIHAVTGKNPYANFLGQDRVPSGYNFDPLNFNDRPFAVLTITVSPVPEPSQAALVLAGLGLLALSVMRRRRMQG